MDITDFVTTTLRNTTPIRLDVRPQHSGNGLGHAHETLFGVFENNVAGPDVSEYNLELKSSTTDTQTLTTLLTCAPRINHLDDRKGATRSLVERYAVQDRDNPQRRNMYVSLNFGRTTHFDDREMYLNHTDDSITLVVDDVPCVGWKTDVLMNAAKRKLNNRNDGALLLTKGNSHLTPNGQYECRFDKSTLYRGFSITNFREALFGGIITVDLRAHSVMGDRLKIRDHGTAFRISEKNLSYLYGEVISIL